jgi:hypothetical protein
MDAPVIHRHASSPEGAFVNALVGSDDVPILATQAVGGVIQRDDPVKQQILRPMFGDEWVQERTFPNTVVEDGETDGFFEDWLANIERLRGELPEDAVLHVGLGGRCGQADFEWHSARTSRRSWAPSRTRTGRSRTPPRRASWLA